MIQHARAVFCQTGVFNEDINKWDMLPLNERNTMLLLKAHFKRANKHRTKYATIKDAGYHSANQMKDKAKDDNNKENKHLQPLPGQPGLAAPGMTMGRIPYYYCWYHGCGPNANHTSCKCTSPSEGHEKTATYDNMLGGIAKIHRKKGEKAYRAPTPP